MAHFGPRTLGGYLCLAGCFCANYGCSASGQPQSAQTEVSLDQSATGLNATGLEHKRIPPSWRDPCRLPFTHAGSLCALPRGIGRCSQGRCQLARCDRGYANCDIDPSNGCEQDIRDDAQHCGSCRHVCPTQTTCVHARCTASICRGTLADCDGDPNNGCETDVATDINSCGACGNACSPSNAQATCAAGVCRISACSAGFADCNGIAGDGCEANLQADAANCGACGNGCSTGNAEATCTAGVCQISACSAGFADCDATAINGCETAIQSDPMNCGTCNRYCQFADAYSACDNGTCTMQSCIPGFGDCNGETSDGCEASLQNDLHNCGACGNDCSALPNTTCIAGACVSNCQTNSDCDGNAANGL